MAKHKRKSASGCKKANGKLKKGCKYVRGGRLVRTKKKR